MTKREVIRMALQHQRPPYVPWSFWATDRVIQALLAYLKCDDLAHVLEGHIYSFSCPSPSTDIGNQHRRNEFGIEYDCSGDNDGIGVVCNQVLPEPTLAGFTLPEPHVPAQTQLARFSDWFHMFNASGIYSLACDLRGTETLMMDFYDHPDFVHALMRRLADYSIAQIEIGLKYDIDAVHFGDDWGQQIGLQTGKPLWMEFIYPEVKRMFKAVKDAGKFISIHSCGDVDELFDDLVGIGLNCFNPFQPEVMDVAGLMECYHGRLTFHGGLSTQRTLPFGTAENVRAETHRLLKMGAHGGYIFAPAHDVEGDVPLENMLAFIELIQNQPGYRDYEEE